MGNVIVWLIVGAIIGWIASQLMGHRDSLLLNLVKREQVATQLLVQRNGVDDRPETTVLAANHQPDVLDRAFLRSGLFDGRATAELPDYQWRAEIRPLYRRAPYLAPDAEPNPLMWTGPSVSGADIPNPRNDAPLVASPHGPSQIEMRDFEEALVGDGRPVLRDAYERRLRPAMRRATRLGTADDRALGNGRLATAGAGLPAFGYRAQRDET